MNPRIALMLLFAVGLGASGCSREKEVVFWLRKAPQQFTGISADAAEALTEREQGWAPVQRYESWEEWVRDGRRITGCEAVLLRLCKEPASPFSRWFIVQALGFVGSQKSVPLLLTILSDENETTQTRSSAAGALGRIGVSEVVQPLVELNRRLKWSGNPSEEEYLDESDETQLKFSVLLGLGMIDDPRVRPVLEAEIQDARADPWRKKCLLEVLANPRPEADFSR